MSPDTGIVTTEQLLLLLTISPGQLAASCLTVSTNSASISILSCPTVCHSSSVSVSLAPAPASPASITTSNIMLD